MSLKGFGEGYDKLAIERRAFPLATRWGFTRRRPRNFARAQLSLGGLRKCGSHHELSYRFASRPRRPRPAIRAEVPRPWPRRPQTTASSIWNMRNPSCSFFDNGRLKQATYNTDQGFGLRAVKDEAVGYAHSSEVSEAALARAADAVRAVRAGYSGFTTPSHPDTHQCPPL